MTALHVEVPKDLPKAQKKYFSDAIDAHNSGQTLAGLFFLMTFIEQYTSCGDYTWLNDGSILVHPYSWFNIMLRDSAQIESVKPAGRANMISCFINRSY